MAESLVELDSLEVVVIVDNEVDPMTPYKNTQFTASNRFIDLALESPYTPTDRGECTKELRMHQLCCGAHGLSLMIVCGTLLYNSNEQRDSDGFDVRPQLKDHHDEQFSSIPHPKSTSGS